jgi:trehalose 6-phosphate phosphatase
MVAELVPAGHDKGTAIVEMLRLEPFRGRTPVFAGDDVTDEAAFAVVNRLDGLSVRIGDPARTAARARLPDVAALHAWLARAAGPTSPEQG